MKSKTYNSKPEQIPFSVAEEESVQKAAVVFYRSTQLKKLVRSNCFYFHALQKSSDMGDLPKGILEAKYVFFYSGGRGTELRFNGYYAKLKSLSKKHKSQISSKKNSKTEFYYEVKIQRKFKFNSNLRAAINPNELVGSYDSPESRCFRNYFPALTTFKKVLGYNKMYSL